MHSIHKEVLTVFLPADKQYKLLFIHWAFLGNTISARLTFSFWGAIVIMTIHTAPNSLGLGRHSKPHLPLFIIQILAVSSDNVPVLARFQQQNSPETYPKHCPCLANTFCAIILLKRTQNSKFQLAVIFCSTLFWGPVGTLIAPCTHFYCLGTLP